MNLDTMNLGTELEQFDFHFLMELALSKVPRDIDTREGSIIFDALAPACYELADMYMHLKQMYLATFIQTAFDDYLDFRVAERGLMRFPATRAVKLGYFEDLDGNPMDIPTGSRFSTVDMVNIIIYQVIGDYGEPGYYRLECETEGVIGNAYVGDLLPISHINGLARAELSTLLTPGQDVEADEPLRTRFLNSLEVTSFGGNIAQYKQQLQAIDGVGAAQIHPTWDGGGTVKCSLVDGEFNPVSASFINTVQEIIDPQQTGDGHGLAPIGHKVTISTPTIRNVDVTVSVDLQQGTALGQIQNAIVSAIDSHFQNLRSQWAIGNKFSEYFLSMFRSQIMVVVLQVDGVINVSRVLLDGLEQDISFEQSGELQELPFSGAVVINEN